MPGPGRDATGKFAKTLESAERDREAVRLRARGWTYQKIADHLGFGGHANAYRAVKRVLTSLPTEGADEARQLELERLDTLTQAALAVMERHHYYVSDGRVVYLGGKDDREPLRDDGPVLQAIDRLLRIGARRAALLGLDAPRQLHIQETAVGELDAAVRELADELAARAGGQGVPSE